MAEIKIAAETRTEFGKGAARRIRRSAKVPAVLYGHGTDPVHVTLPGHDLMLALKKPNPLLSIELGSEKHLVIPKQVQRDPLKGFLEHADLLIVRRGEKVVVEVPVNSQITAAVLTLPSGVELACEPELLIVNVTHAPTAAEVEAELEEAEAEAGIEHDEPEPEVGAITDEEAQAPAADEE